MEVNHKLRKEMPLLAQFVEEALSEVWTVAAATEAYIEYIGVRNERGTAALICEIGSLPVGGRNPDQIIRGLGSGEPEDANPSAFTELVRNILAVTHEVAEAAACR